MDTVAAISGNLRTPMNFFSRVNAAIPASRIMRAAILLMLVISASLVFFAASPRARAMVALRLCEAKSDHVREVECVYDVIRQELLRGGVEPAITMFVAANAMYQNTLDVDCHAAVHRVGDMAYYDLFKYEPDLSRYEFPPETTICGGGFYHGFFEHLIQDNPRPGYIVEACNFFRDAGPQYLKKASVTCFHAAGHGLIRANAEHVPRARWGEPAPFVDPPLRTCDLMTGVTALEKNLCKTGVMSIFIQMNSYANYGFSKKSAFDTCDSLVFSQRETCYRMASLMISQFEDDYTYAWSRCSSAIPALRRACIAYVPIGLFTNGINPRSYRSVLDFCSEVSVSDAEHASLCYEQLGQVLGTEYKDPHYAPDCGLFPEEYRDLCTHPKPKIL